MNPSYMETLQSNIEGSYCRRKREMEKQRSIVRLPESSYLIFFGEDKCGGKSFFTHLLEISTEVLIRPIIFFTQVNELGEEYY